MLVTSSARRTGLWNGISSTKVPMRMRRVRTAIAAASVSVAGL